MKMVTSILAVCLLAVTLTGSAMAQGCGGSYGAGGSGGTLANNLFQQYYTQSAAQQTAAGLYPSPHPVPWKVGSTYYTYQPLMPHELMWQHSRNYYNYYAGPGAFYSNPCNGRGGGSALNKTTVVWQSGANHMGPLPFTVNPLAGFQYRLASRHYCLGGNCGGIGGACASGQCGGVAAGCPSCTAAAEQAGGNLQR